ncbi:hypothetical protein B0H34DRAFT_178224 [Crassisporium funariophilum]|nr:hypothetical protein B0H34DRAFT_178224 [Crassisporium funariophilum]
MGGVCFCCGRCVRSLSLFPRTERIRCSIPPSLPRSLCEKEKREDFVKKNELIWISIPIEIERKASILYYPIEVESGAGSEGRSVLLLHLLALPLPSLPSFLLPSFLPSRLLWLFPLRPSNHPPDLPPLWSIHPSIYPSTITHSGTRSSTRSRNQREIAK